MHMGGVRSFLAPWKQEHKGPKSRGRLAAWVSESADKNSGNPLAKGKGFGQFFMLVCFSLALAPKP